MMKIKRQNKLRTYLAVTAGVGCAASVAEGAVTFYGVNSANDTNDDPLGISIGPVDVNPLFSVVNGQSNENTSFASLDGDLFTRGADRAAVTTLSVRDGIYLISSSFVNGAVLGDQNYANVSFNGGDGIFEAVAQFNFDGMGGGFLVAIATTNNQPNPLDLSGVGGPALSISQGRDLIEAAAVPEPSSLVLLALGATGLAARRKRKMAA